jgi:hypothetical protein
METDVKFLNLNQPQFNPIEFSESPNSENGITNETDAKTYSMARKFFEGIILVIANIITFTLIYAYCESFRAEWEAVFGHREIKLDAEKQVSFDQNQNQKTTTPDTDTDLHLEDQSKPNNPTGFKLVSKDVHKAFNLFLQIDKRREIIANASLEDIKIMLKYTFPSDPELQDDLLPFISDEHLKKLSISDFHDETQIGFVLWGKNDDLKQLYVSYLNSPNTFAEIFAEMILSHLTHQKHAQDFNEIVRRLALLTNGTDLAKAIDQNKLSRDWVYFLSREELPLFRLYEAKDDRQSRAPLFPKDVNIKALYSGEKRFSVFTPEEIRASKGIKHNDSDYESLFFSGSYSGSVSEDEDY